MGGAVWEGGEGGNSREEMIAMKVMEDCGGGLTAVMVLQCPGGQGQREGLLNGTARGRVGEVSGLQWEQGWTRTQEADYYMFHNGTFTLQMNLLLTESRN